MKETKPEQGPEGADDESRLCDVDIAEGMRSEANDDTYRVAWREFEQRHLPHIKAFIEFKARELSSDEKDDVLVETLMRIERGIAGYRDRGSGGLRAWSFRVAQSVLQDVWRGRLHKSLDGIPGASGLISFEDVERHFGLELAEAAQSDSGPALGSGRGSGNGTAALRVSVLRRAFESLNEIDRTIIWCKMVHGDSDAYVATITGKPVEQVRKYRGKAVKKLRQRFERLLEAESIAS